MSNSNSRNLIQDLRILEFRIRNHNLLTQKVPQKVVSLGGSTEGTKVASLEEVPALKRNFDVLPLLPCPQSQIPVWRWLAHFTPNRPKSQMTNGPSQLWKKDTNSHSKKYLLSHFLPKYQKARIGRKGHSLLQNRAVEEILPESPEYYLRIFLVPKRTENEAHDRSFHSEQICSNTKLQNGESEQKWEIHFVPAIGHFDWSEGCLFACPDTSDSWQNSLWWTRSSSSELYHLAYQGAHMYSLISWK